MVKFKITDGLGPCRTPCKTSRKSAFTASPVQCKAAKISLKYKRGFRKSPGKIERVKLALSEVSNGVSVRKAAKNNNLSESFLRRRIAGEVSLESRNGPRPVFSVKEEEEMAKWLSEMSKRGMGLGVAEFLDFVASVLKKDKRKNNFKHSRPSYTWYYSFMARNAHIVELRKESSLENSRAKVTSQELDKWFANYYMFVSELHLLDKPNRVYNADESGFSMGSKAGSVIGPTKSEYPGNLPHLSGKSKKRLTAMFCGNAEGDIIPPFLVYPCPQPTAYDPLINSRRGTVIDYTEKGWMNTKTFFKFLKHFNEFACHDRPVILIIDSVSSHIDLNVFTFAKENGIELYRLIPNATHFLQPLDNGVFGPLKKAWYQIVRRNTKENPDKSIGKENFAAKLHEAFMNFYRPLTVVNSFKATGIFPIDRSKIPESRLMPAMTFQSVSSEKEHTHVDNNNNLPDTNLANVLPCCVFTENRSDLPHISSSRPVSVLPGTSENSVNQDPVSEDVSGTSMLNTAEFQSPLSMLAEVAFNLSNSKSTSPSISSSMSNLNSVSSDVSTSVIDTPKTSQCSSRVDETVSPSVEEALVFPICKDVKKRISTSDTLPDCLTSSKSIRASALKQLNSVRQFARKEMAAKKRYMKEKLKSQVKEKKSKKAYVTQGKGICAAHSKIKKPGVGKAKRAKKTLSFSAVPKSYHCSVCKTLTEDSAGWVQCDICDSWLHVGCIPEDHDYDHAALTSETVEFFCHFCVN